MWSCVCASARTCVGQTKARKKLYDSHTFKCFFLFDGNDPHLAGFRFVKWHISHERCKSTLCKYTCTCWYAHLSI